MHALLYRYRSATALNSKRIGVASNARLDPRQRVGGVPHEARLTDGCKLRLWYHCTNHLLTDVDQQPEESDVHLKWYGVQNPGH